MIYFNAIEYWMLIGNKNAWYFDKTVDNLRIKFGKNIIVRGGAYKTNSDKENKDEIIKK